MTWVSYKVEILTRKLFFVIFTCLLNCNIPLLPRQLLTELSYHHRFQKYLWKGVYFLVKFSKEWRLLKCKFLPRCFLWNLTIHYLYLVSLRWTYHIFIYPVFFSFETYPQLWYYVGEMRDQYFKLCNNFFTVIKVNVQMKRFMKTHNTKVFKKTAAKDIF